MLPCGSSPRRWPRRCASALLNQLERLRDRRMMDPAFRRKLGDDRVRQLALTVSFERSMPSVGTLLALMRLMAGTSSAFGAAVRTTSGPSAGQTRVATVLALMSVRARNATQFGPTSGGPIAIPESFVVDGRISRLAAL